MTDDDFCYPEPSGDFFDYVDFEFELENVSPIIPSFILKGEDT